MSLQQLLAYVSNTQLTEPRWPSYLTNYCKTQCWKCHQTSLRQSTSSVTLRNECSGQENTGGQPVWRVQDPLGPSGRLLGQAYGLESTRHMAALVWWYHVCLMVYARQFPYPHHPHLKLTPAGNDHCSFLGVKGVCMKCPRIDIAKGILLHSKGSSTWILLQSLKQRGLLLHTPLHTKTIG